MQSLTYLFLRYSIAATATAAIAVLGWLCWHVFYNIWLHPLRRYPGPKLWSATRLPWCWCQYRGTLSQRLLELHIRYGGTVRVAPNELSYATSTAWKTIYGQRSIEMGKDPVFSLLTPTGVQNILTADRETHIRQRRLLSHAFSEKALREQEGILETYVEKLLNQVGARASSEALDMTAWFCFTTFDLIGDLSFGEQFGCLDNGDYDPFVRSIQAISKELTFMQMAKYYGVDKIRSYLMPKSVAGARAQNMKRAMGTVDRRINKDTSRKDFLHYILAANDAKGMFRAEINVNAFSLCIAGSESTSTALTGAFYYMLTHPQVYDKLVHEVRTTFQSEADIKLGSVHNLEYLDAVLNETLRIYPPVAVTLPRVVPPGGESIDGDFVPAGTTVGVNHYSTYHHPDNFYKPDCFMPERWLPVHRDEAPFAHDDRSCMQAFSYGPRNCLGKNLARAEMRLIMARLLWRFDLRLAGPEMAAWRDNQKIFGFWVKPALWCRITPVNRDAGKC